MSETIGGSQHTAATILKELGQVTGMVHEQANRLMSTETRIVTLEERMVSVLQALPIEIRRHQFVMVTVGAMCGSSIGVVAAMLLMKGVLQ